MTRAMCCLRLESGEVLAVGWHRDPIAAEAEEMARARGCGRAVWADGTQVFYGPGGVLVVPPTTKIGAIT